MAGKEPDMKTNEFELSGFVGNTPDVRYTLDIHLPLCYARIHRYASSD